MIRLAVILILLSFSAVTSSYAQTADEIDRKKTVDEEILEMEIIIVDNFFKSCEKNGRMNRYYDCRCLSMEYLDEYKKAMGNGTYASLLHKINDKCPDKVAIAGIAYKSCLSMMSRQIKNYEEYCSCFSKKFTKKLASHMTDNIHYHSRIKPAIHSACSAEVPKKSMAKYNSAIGKARSSFIYFPPLVKEKE